MNIRFVYLYRDGGNNKNWGDVVFSNPRNADARQMAKKAIKMLNRIHKKSGGFADEVYFAAHKAGVPDLHFREYAYDAELDHDWHEFSDFEPTDGVPNDSQGRDIEEFIDSLRKAAT